MAGQTMLASTDIHPFKERSTMHRGTQTIFIQHQTRLLNAVA
jgi:hypothetical protein